VTISIFNLNCWLFPPPISAEGDARLAAIIAMIKEYGADIISLQEVWLNAHLRRLRQSLPGYHCISSGTPLYNQSGLALFLKEKPLFSEIKHFERSLGHNGTEWLLRKGYISAKVLLGGKEYTVIDTHLYAAFSRAGKTVTESQFREVVRNAPQGNTIICGDLNLEDEAVSRINEGIFSRLCDEERTLDGKNPYSNKRFNKLNMKKRPEGKKIDYMLYKGIAGTAIEYKVVKAPLVSDHYPMFCKIHFS
jgi:endonuclease/exonuclease/phosphatase family metal-dependent hydrolase